MADDDLSTPADTITAQRPTVPASAFSTRPPDATIDERIFQGSMKGSGRGLWAGSLLGLLVGCALGTLAALCIGGITLSPAIILGFGVLGMAKGSGLLSGVGMIAGGVSSATKEVLKEVKASESRVTQLLNQAFPQLKGVTVKADNENSAETAQTQQVHNKSSVFHKFFNWKVMLTMAALGAIGGLALAGGIVALGPSTHIFAAVCTVLGLEPTSKVAAGAAVMKGMAVVGAMFGSLFGMNVSVLANKVVDGFGYVMSGRAFERKKEALTPALAPVVPIQKIEAPAKTEEQTQETTKHRDLVTAQRQIAANAVGQGV